MKKSIKGIGVDAGIIVIADISHYQEYERNEKAIASENTLDLENGEYDISWKIADTWNGTIEGSGVVTVQSGKIIISDPCYIANNWDKWLDDFDSGSIKNIIYIDSMGGDGVYTMEINLQRRDNEK